MNEIQSVKIQFERTVVMFNRRKLYSIIILIGIIFLSFTALVKSRSIERFNFPKNNENAEKVNFDKKNRLVVDDLKPVDHIDAVRMEQDGDLNKDFKKEIFLGNHESIDNLSEKDKTEKLTEIFHAVDLDKNGQLSLMEMQDWISKKVEEHFLENHEDNERVFKFLDLDNDGFVHWKEFHKQFLMAKGHNEKQVDKHIEEYDTLSIDDEDKDAIVNYKFRWTDADSDPQDNKLTLEEFKEFRHPERSTKMIQRMVDEILDNLDSNKDGRVIEEEFAAVPKGDHHPQFEKVDETWQKERRKEFNDVIDINHDGIVDKDELRKYVDPRNKQHALMEAKNLLQVADNDNNGAVSLEEVIENIDLFFGSKLVDANSALHDEF
ncbi:DgyrCDS4697 [Dimorphilus gyrociliatus]|uniref:45 kDa calcium-binding protein n=1 Tax=Dimorphilus gyrociliatus TaxID=2664684 RepID=A0A7I8VHT1_9ANNE|nr:DgyrCDS4697 [Dimorphilus gyrociliatus]